MKAALAAVFLILAAPCSVALAQIPRSPVPAPVATVHIRAFAYSPAALTVQAVRFVNDDEAAHTVTAPDRSFDSGYLAQGDHWTHTFVAPGDYAYLCTYHQFMEGSVSVKAP